MSYLSDTDDKELFSDVYDATLYGLDEDVFEKNLDKVKKLRNKS